MGFVRSNLQAKDVGRGGELWWTVSAHTSTFIPGPPRKGKALPFSPGSVTVDFAMAESMSPAHTHSGRHSPEDSPPSHTRC